MALTLPRDTSLIPITLSVITVHLLLVFYSALFFTSHIPISKPRDKILVKTVKLNPKQNNFNPPKAPSSPLPPEPIPEPIAEVEPVAPTPLPEPEPVAPEPTPEPKVESKPEPKPEPKPVTPKPLPKKKPIHKKTTPKTPPKPVKKPTPPKPPAPVKKETPKKPETKKETPKKTAPEIPKEPPRPDPQIEAMKQKKREYIENARSLVAKLDRKSGQLKETGSLEKVTLPSQLGELNIDSLEISSDKTLSAPENRYRSLIASRLKLSLHLPEYGVVKLKLTLNRQGKVTAVTEIQSESSANKAHIQKALPQIIFQPFGDNFSGLDSYTFQVTLNSE